MFVHVATPQTESELAVMVSLLDAHDIPYFVHNRGFGGLYPGPQLHIYNARRIMVRADRAPEARDLLAVFAGPPADFETDRKLSLWDKLRVIGEAVLFSWFIPSKRAKLPKGENDGT